MPFYNVTVGTAREDTNLPSQNIPSIYTPDFAGVVSS